MSKRVKQVGRASKRTSPQGTHREVAEVVCYYDNKKYAKGSLLCISGKLHKCIEFPIGKGYWQDQKKKC